MDFIQIYDDLEMQYSSGDWELDDAFKDEVNLKVQEIEDRFFDEQTLKVEKEVRELKSKMILSEVIQSLLYTLDDLKEYTYSLPRSERYIRNRTVKSLTNLYDRFEGRYEIFFPELFKRLKPKVKNLPNERLMFVSDRKLETFKKYERVLRKKHYISREGQWIMNKQDLVKFFLYCKAKGFFTDLALRKHFILRFFEKRYVIKIGDQGKKSKYSKLKPLDYLHAFDFLAIID